MKLRHTLFPCLCLLPCLLLAGDDPELTRVVSSFKIQRLDAESAQLASYADQLEKLRQTYAAKGESAAEKKVKAEFKSVMEKLNVLNAAKTEAAVGTTEGMIHPHDGGNELESIFGEEKESTNRTPGQGKPQFKVLGLRDATLTPEVKMTRDFWAKPDAAARWTITDLPAGKYRVTLVYRSSEESFGGTGQLEISGSTTPLTFKVAAGQADTKESTRLDIAKLEIEKCPIDLTIKSTSLAQEGKPLFMLQSVQLREESATTGQTPGGPPKPPGKTDKPEKPDMNKKKVDF
jgi:hypothetical protein